MTRAVGRFARAAMMACLVVGCTRAQPVFNTSRAAPPQKDSAPALRANEPVLATSAPLPTEAPSQRSEPAEEPQEPAPSLPVEVEVPGDLVALVAHGPLDSARAIVYLHGICGDVTKYLAWAEAAQKLGTVIALRGDDKCKEPGRYKWGLSPERTDRRLVLAVRAVGEARVAASSATTKHRALPLDAEAITLVGYSQGSACAERLIRAFPSRYRRALLIAGPKEHRTASFRDALGIAFMAGEKDLSAHIEASAKKATKAGVPARYFTLPDARHGEYGPDAVRVMGDALTWVYENTVRAGSD